MESIIETFYNVTLTKNLFMTGDYQFCMNPGYNRDRGPVNFFLIRVQAKF